MRFRGIPVHFLVTPDVRRGLIVPMTLYDTQTQPAKAARDMTKALAASAENNLVTFVRKGSKCPLLTSGLQNRLYTR